MMIDTPQILETSEQLTAVIHLTIPREQIQAEMGPAMGEVMAVVSAQGLRKTGPVFSYHFKMDPKTFDFEVGVPVATAVTASGRVKPGRLPVKTVARTVYRGPYEGLGPAWGEFCSWITANGHKAVDGLWERYVSGPESSPNPEDWQTELNQPISK